MSPVQVQVLLLAFFSAVSFVFSAEVYENSEEMKFCTTRNPEKESIVEPNFDDEVPPPPGSELLRTRKGRGRSESFHKSAEQMEKLDTRAVFEDPKRYEFFDHREERLDSGATDVEEWEGFIMDINSMYPSRTRSNSTETGKNTEIQSPSDSSNNRRKIFASKSFKTSSTKMRPRLSSFSEVEEDEYYEFEN